MRLREVENLASRRELSVTSVTEEGLGWFYKPQETDNVRQTLKDQSDRSNDDLGLF